MSEQCEHCGSDKIYHGPPDCPSCGAPNCCQICCKINTLEMQLEKAKKALEIIRDFPCIINRTGETHSMKHIAASTLKELEK
jgi:hypothetical protein